MHEHAVIEHEMVPEVVLNRPGKLNALTLRVLGGLMAATEQVAASATLRGLLVRATGR